MAGPAKRSVMIAGHATSISLEPVFWEALREAAAADGLPLSALVARIDAERTAGGGGANLASALRVWLFERARFPSGHPVPSRHPGAGRDPEDGAGLDPGLRRGDGEGALG